MYELRVRDDKSNVLMIDGIAEAIKCRTTLPKMVKRSSIELIQYVVVEDGFFDS